MTPGDLGDGRQVGEVSSHGEHAVGDHDGPPGSPRPVLQSPVEGRHVQMWKDGPRPGASHSNPVDYAVVVQLVGENQGLGTDQ